MKLDLIGFARRPQGDDGMKKVLTEGIKEFVGLKPTDEEEIKYLIHYAVHIQSEFEDEDDVRELINLLDKRVQAMNQIEQILPCGKRTIQYWHFSLHDITDRPAHKPPPYLYKSKYLMQFPLKYSLIFCFAFGWQAVLGGKV